MKEKIIEENNLKRKKNKEIVIDIDMSNRGENEVLQSILKNITKSQKEEDSQNSFFDMISQKNSKEQNVENPQLKQEIKVKKPSPNSKSKTNFNGTIEETTTRNSIESNVSHFILKSYLRDMRSSFKQIFSNFISSGFCGCKGENWNGKKGLFSFDQSEINQIINRQIRNNISNNKDLKKKVEEEEECSPYNQEEEEDEFDLNNLIMEEGKHLNISKKNLSNLFNNCNKKISNLSSIKSAHVSDSCFGNYSEKKN
jgi:hypothetical protein